MFLTRAFEIINREGFLTFKYALGQKMRENMTDEKVYQSYIKNVEPRQNAISENQCVQVVSVKENSTVKQVCGKVTVQKGWGTVRSRLSYGIGMPR